MAWATLKQQDPEFLIAYLRTAVLFHGLPSGSEKIGVPSTPVPVKLPVLARARFEEANIVSSRK